MGKRIENYVDRLNLEKGKTILITGGNSGIGFQCARLLAKKDWRVILAGRNKERVDEAVSALRSEFPKASIEGRLLDLSSRESIDLFVHGLIEDKVDIGVFYCNAGIYRVPFALAYDNFESQLAVNAVSNLLLYEGLKEYFLSLSHEVRFILTSSVAARLNRFDIEKDFDGVDYDKSRNYGKSKLAVNALYLYLLKETENTNIHPLLVHPGIVFTPLIEKAYPGRRVLLGLKRFARSFFNKPDKGALPALLAITSSREGPCIYGPRGIGHMAGYPTLYHLYQGNLDNSEKIVKTMKNRAKVD